MKVQSEDFRYYKVYSSGLVLKVECLTLALCDVMITYVILKLHEYE